MVSRPPRLGLGIALASAALLAAVPAAPPPETRSEPRKPKGKVPRIIFNGAAKPDGYTHSEKAMSKRRKRRLRGKSIKETNNAE